MGEPKTTPPQVDAMLKDSTGGGGVASTGMVKTLGTPLRNFDTATTSLSSSSESSPTWLITVAVVTSAVVATAGSAVGVAVAAVVAPRAHCHLREMGFTFLAPPISSSAGGRSKSTSTRFPKEKTLHARPRNMVLRPRRSPLRPTRYDELSPNRACATWVSVVALS